MGTPESAVPSLEAILAARHEIPLVVTQPDRPAGRGNVPRPPPVKLRAEAHGLPVIQPAKVRTPEFLAAIAAAAPDVIAVVAYGRLLTRPVREVAAMGAVNLHFSLLPAYRGAAPVQWALARGERVTGVTTFRLDDGLDTGELLAHRQVPILPGEHAPALLSRLSVEGAALLVGTLAGLAAGSVRPAPQDGTLATAAPLLLAEHGYWDPAWRANELSGRVRGFDPWPGVWAMCTGKRLRLLEAGPVPEATTDEAAGTILALVGDAVRIACAAGTVAAISSIQPEGGRAMRARDAVNGRLLTPGARLGRLQPTA